MLKVPVTSDDHMQGDAGAPVILVRLHGVVAVEVHALSLVLAQLLAAQQRQAAHRTRARLPRIFVGELQSIGEPHGFTDSF